jgi:hypothetical protein
MIEVIKEPSGYSNIDRMSVARPRVMGREGMRDPNRTTNTTENEKSMFNTYLPYVAVAVAIVGFIYWKFIKK